MSGRRPGNTLDIVGPDNRFTGLFYRRVSRDIPSLAQICTDPICTVHTPSDDGSVLVDDLHHAAGGKVIQPEPILEMFEQNADVHDCDQLPCPILNRPRHDGQPFAGGASTDRLADCKPLTAQHLLEIVAVGVVGAAVLRHLERGSDVGAVECRQQDVADVARQLGLYLPQYLIIRLNAVRAD